MITLLFLTGCNNPGGQDVAGTTYDLTLTPVTLWDQSNVFNEVDELVLEVEMDTGTISHTLMASAQGESDSVEELPALIDATLWLRGLNAAGDTVVVGRTPSMTMNDGSETLDVLVAQPDQIGWLTDLEDANAGGALVAVGSGRFLMFGGSRFGLLASTSGISDVMAFNVAPPTSDLVFENVGVLPVMDSGETGRVGHSATLLTGNHDDSGKVLIIGGSTDYGDNENVDPGMYLWDPNTDTVEELADGPSVFLHQAVEDTNGTVVFSGGWSATDPEYVLPIRKIFSYDPMTQQSSVVGTSETDLIAHASARLGDEGVLICGGITYNDDNTFDVVPTCYLVSTAGNLQETEPLPLGLMFPAMTTLSDGSVLVTGGLVGSTSNLTYADTIEASSTAYRFHEGEWETTGSMANRRAMHSATLLPDGRVLIVGGVTSSKSPWANGGTAIACVEIFDPATNQFSQLETCDEDDEEGALPARTAFPMVATDSEFGTLVVGGIGTDDRPVEGALFMPTEQ